MLAPVWKRNDRKASILIFTFSIIVFAAVLLLGRVQLNVSVGFDVHLFALTNAIINTLVSILLVLALIAVKRKNYVAHRNIMMTAMVLSMLFLVSYICHHLLAGETKFGDIDHNGFVSLAEEAKIASTKKIYYFILFTHIPLAGIILPFILFTAYRALVGDWPRHRSLAKITWPIWFYVAVTGVLVYYMISPYYS